MLDIKFVRANPDIVKENIKKKFQDDKLPLVDEVIEYDKELREAKTRVEYLRSQRNTISKQIGVLMGQGKKEEAEEAKKQVAAMADEMAALDVKEQELTEKVRKIMLVIPNIISAITTSSMMERVLSGECTWGEQDMVRLMVSLSM